MNVHSIELGNHEFEGENNAYLLESGDETALIDTGIHRPDIDAQLRDGLADLGRSVSDLDDILLTHHHMDHSGLAGALAAESGASVYVHEIDAPLVRRDEDAIEAYDSLQERRFEEWEMPEPKRRELREFFAQNPPVDPPETVTEVTSGDVINVGQIQLTVRHAPGHTAGHCLYEFDRDDTLEAFVGDVVLPVYTPNVGGADLRLDGALARYLESLSAIVDSGYGRLWPGHRNVIDAPAERATTIIEHHRDRTENVLAVLDDESPMSAWDVSADLFGSLEGIHILHGPGEAYSHLEHLVHHDVVDRTDGRYRLADRAIDLEDVLRV
ncbi:MBL fold metallo-hydrolase [Halovivax gelatinilyticus]|uniref:MBL fold metallo-hydrolase n=1 Tax=Halovivax gelatinilyticus TaxID=2961597 RepID=UPI0020CA4CDF|nr:MBL fold metallo-hydrolase [Halovivax gelatinilyticus]